MLLTTLTPAAALAMPPNDLDACLADSWASAVVVIPNLPAITLAEGTITPGDRIAALSPDGLCVGVSTWRGASTALTIWADDPVTPEIDGLRDGDPVSLVVWDSETHTLLPAGDVTIAYDPVFAPQGGFAYDDLYVVASADDVPAFDRDEVALGAAYPNPVRQRTTIPFSLGAEADVTVEVFDALGRRVAVPFDAHLGPGNHSVPFDAAELASGVYVVRLRAGEAVRQGQLTVTR